VGQKPAGVTYAFFVQYRLEQHRGGNLAFHDQVGLTRANRFYGGGSRFQVIPGGDDPVISQAVLFRLGFDQFGISGEQERRQSLSAGIGQGGEYFIAPGSRHGDGSPGSSQYFLFQFGESHATLPISRALRLISTVSFPLRMNRSATAF
jgi:hypothetical protein